MTHQPFSTTLPHGTTTVGQLIHSATQRLEQAQVGFGHGTQNAQQEATWLILWSLGQPLDSALGTEENSIENHPVTPDQQAQAATLIEERIRTRKPAACLPGAIDHSDKARIARADWDAGRRRIYPHREGVPMIFLAAGVKDWKPQDDTITQKDIAAFF